MYKKILPASLAGILVLAACTGMPTASPDTTASGEAASQLGGGEWGYGSGGWSAADSGFVATATADSSSTGRGGGAIGSGN